jgi:tRNA-modifying protein YgfZ
MPDSSSAIEPVPAGGTADPSNTDVERDYAALHHGALVIDRSSRGRWRFSGARARETVAGLVTNDVVSLEPGRGCYAAALTPKGKIVADVRIFALHDAVLVDASPRAATGWAEIVRKYVNPRVTPYASVAESTGALGVFGPTASAVVSTAMHLGSAALPSLPYAHQEYAQREPATVVARVPDAGPDGFEMFFPADAMGEWIERLRIAGAVIGTTSVLDIARVELGRPEWGPDMDEGTIPQEANLDDLGAISYTKGCYTGQETVARIHFRGHVNRHLRGLQLVSEGSLPPLRATLSDATGTAVGDVRSIVRSPRYGPIALAMVRREVQTGASLIARWETSDSLAAGDVEATVVELPFSEQPIRSDDEKPVTSR